LLNFFHIERKGHSITILLSTLDIEIPSEIKIYATILDKHCIPSRYPNTFDEEAPADYYTSRDAEECIRCAETILRWVEEYVRKTSENS